MRSSCQGEHVPNPVRAARLEAAAPHEAAAILAPTGRTDQVGLVAECAPQWLRPRGCRLGRGGAGRTHGNRGWSGGDQQILIKFLLLLVVRHLFLVASCY